MVGFEGFFLAASKSAGVGNDFVHPKYFLYRIKDNRSSVGTREQTKDAAQTLSVLLLGND